jgi:CspA family cold shock protein
LRKSLAAFLVEDHQGALGVRKLGAKEPPREENYVPRDEEIRADVFEVSGSVKWFDPAKGYGFILPDEDLPDILLHVSCLRRDGFQTAYEGSRIVCDVVFAPRASFSL